MPEHKTARVITTLTRTAIPLGAACIIVGMAVRNILDGTSFTSTVVIGPVGLGTLLLVTGVAMNLRWLKERMARRRFLTGLNAAAMVLLAFALLVILNGIVVLTPRTDGWFVDCTRDRIYTLSPKTLNVLNGLTSNVTVTVLMGSGKAKLGQSGEVDIGRRLRDIVRLYRASSRKVKVEIIDYYREKLRVETLARRVTEEVAADTVLVESAGRCRKLTFYELVELPQATSSDPSPTPGFIAEERITSAIVKLTDEKAVTVYFTTGHAELPGTGADRASVKLFADALKRDNYVIRELNLLKKQEVPSDCDVLIMAGPVVPFEKEEVDALDGYLRRGGKVFLMLRPSAARGDIGMLNTLLRQCNVKAEPTQLVIEVYRDAASGAGVGDLRVVVQDYGAHAITEGLGRINCLMQHVAPVEPVRVDASPLQALAAPSLASSYKAHVLMRSSKESWAETDMKAPKVTFDKGKDRKGPIGLAVAVEWRPLRKSVETTGPAERKGARLVVVGGVGIAADSAFGKYVGNRTFVMNAVSWLAEKETRLGIPPRRPGRPRLVESPAAWKTVFFITVLGMPMASMLVGTTVWWLRRR